MSQSEGISFPLYAMTLGNIFYLIIYGVLQGFKQSLISLCKTPLERLCFSCVYLCLVTSALFDVCSHVIWGTNLFQAIQKPMGPPLPLFHWLRGLKSGLRKLN